MPKSKSKGNKRTRKNSGKSKKDAKAKTDQLASEANTALAIKWAAAAQMENKAATLLGFFYPKLNPLATTKGNQTLSPRKLHDK